MTLDFKVPSYVSKDGRDLLRKLLTNNPGKRATIQEVMEHPWYMEGLPPSALKMNDVYLKNKADASIQPIQEAVKIVEQAMKHPGDSLRKDPISEVTDDLIAVALEEEANDDAED